MELSNKRPGLISHRPLHASTPFPGECIMHKENIVATQFSVVFFGGPPCWPAK